MDADGSGRTMSSSLKRYWRVLCTGVGFLPIGIGGLFVFPLLNLMVRQPKRRRVIARDLVQLTFRCIVRSMCALGVFYYETKGIQRLERDGQLILANHPTLIDIVFLMAFVRQADCIVKARLRRNLFTRATVRAAGYIANDDDALRVIEDCIASVRDGGNLIIFPEGTRTPTHGGISLKRGAANIAVRVPCNVTPVRIHCTPPMLVKGGKWWRLPVCASRFCFDVMDDIDIQPFLANAGGEALAARQLTGYMQKCFIEPNDRGND